MAKTDLNIVDGIKGSRDGLFYVFENKTPPEVWQWLMERMELSYAGLHVVWIIRGTELEREYNERIRNY